MADLIQLRRGTKKDWEEKNPLLAEGEQGYVLDDPNLYKMGNGKDRWNALPWRGYDGTIVHEFGNSKQAVLSQDFITRYLEENSSIIEMKGNDNTGVYHTINTIRNTEYRIILDHTWNYQLPEGSTINPGYSLFAVGYYDEFHNVHTVKSVKISEQDKLRKLYTFKTNDDANAKYYVFVRAKKGETLRFSLSAIDDSQMASIIPSNTTPNIDTNTNTLDLGSDAVLVFKDKYILLKYAENSRAVPLCNNNSTAIRVVFNILENKFEALSYNEATDNYQIQIGTIRTKGKWSPEHKPLPDNIKNVNFPFTYTINGKLPLFKESMDKLKLDPVLITGFPYGVNDATIDVNNGILNLSADPVLFGQNGEQIPLMNYKQVDIHNIQLIPSSEEEARRTSLRKLIVDTKNQSIYTTHYNAIIDQCTEYCIGYYRFIQTSVLGCAKIVDYNFSFNVTEIHKNYDLKKEDIRLFSYSKVENARAVTNFSIGVDDFYSITVYIKGGYQYALNGWLNDSVNNGVASPIYDTTWLDSSRKFILSECYKPNQEQGLKPKFMKIGFRKTSKEKPDMPFTIEDLLKNVTIVLERRSGDNNITHEIEKLKASQNYCAISCNTGIDFIAHRGFHLNDVPENSLASYRMAGLMGFKMAETDFCGTKDKKLVLLHDGTLDRTFVSKDGSPITNVSVNSMNLRELQELYKMKSNDVRYQERIPTLEEYFIECKRSHVFPVPEIKGSGVSNEEVKQALEIGKRIVGEKNFAFCSFSAEKLDYARSLSKDVKLYYITSYGIANTINTVTQESRNSENTIWYPAYSYEALTKESIELHHSCGMKVAVWTVPASKLDYCINLGVDEIATDTIASNLTNQIGFAVNSNNSNFADFLTNGTVDGKTLKLDTNQYVRYNYDHLELGAMYISVIAKGSYTLNGVTFNDADFTQHIYQSIISRGSAALNLVAKGLVEINFIECKFVKF